MRPAEFTPESIIEAGQTLQAAGRNITGFALRQKVGGGNPSRLKQIWDEHANSQSVAKAEPVAELPIEVAEEVATVTKALTERLNLLAVQLNDKAVKAAERRVAEIIRTAGEQREQAERELADASQTVDELETKLDEAQAGAQDLAQRLTDSGTTNQAQAVELAQVRERLALIEQTAKAAGEQHAAEVGRMNAAIEAERIRHQREAAQIREERDQVRAELATVTARAEAADQAHQEQRKVAGQEALRAAERLTKTQAERDQARTEAGTSREELAKTRGQLEASETYKAELLAALKKGGEAQPKKASTPKKGE